MRSRHLIAILVAGVLLTSGCANHSWFGGSRDPRLTTAENPLFIPTTDRDFMWNTVVDTVDDYFKIQSEQRVRLIGNYLSEGRIETVPTIGSTYLEPWRHDSTPGYEKLHASLQTIRRQATVRVIPAPGGYLIDLQIQKELEDLDRPEFATAGSTYQRHDGTIVRLQGATLGSAQQLGWIALGRDTSLEQRLLLELRAKFTKVGMVTSPLPVNDANPAAY
jgi:hypothetical protein